MKPMQFTLKTNFADVAKRVTELGKQATYAAAVALTRTGQDIKAGIAGDMQSAFDRPTAYTLRSLYLKPATKTNLQVKVWLKDDAGKGTPAARYLWPQIAGGNRVQKGMERMLQRAGLLGASQYAVPAVGAELDSNGNVKRSQVVQILSQLKLQRSAGYESKATGSARSNRTIARQGVTYFALASVRRGLQPGIYLKRRFAHGSAIRPVFIFVDAVSYQPRLKFFETGDAIAQSRFLAHFETEIEKAIATARLGGKK
jgi:hypothetical protein